MGSEPTSDSTRDDTRDDTERAKRDSETPAALRIKHQALWVDQQIRLAMERGEFDNLPGAGKPIADLGVEHDKDWWLKKLIERERITGVLPPSLQLRKDDAELDAQLDRHTAESEVRRLLEDFNARVLKARYTPVDGPPLITQPRDVEAEVAAWRARAQERSRARREAAAAAQEASAPARERRRWWRRA
jgi:hypothetical protein